MRQYSVEKIIDDLKYEEGYRAHCYECSMGAHTVGYGRNIDEEQGGLGISEDEAEFLLKNDIHRSALECERFHWFENLNNRQQSVIIHLCFWIGYPRLTQFKKMAAALANEDWETAADELMDSKLARDIPGRAERLAKELKNA